MDPLLLLFIPALYAVAVLAGESSPYRPDT